MKDCIKLLEGFGLGMLVKVLAGGGFGLLGFVGI